MISRSSRSVALAQLCMLCGTSFLSSLPGARKADHGESENENFETHLPRCSASCYQSLNMELHYHGLEKEVDHPADIPTSTLEKDLMTLVLESEILKYKKSNSERVRLFALLHEAEEKGKREAGAIRELLEKEQEEEERKNALSCGMCGSLKPLKHLHFLELCSHYFCVTCLNGMIVQKISIGKCSEIACITCSTPLAQAEIKQLLSEAEHEEYLRNSVQEVINSNSAAFIFCPNTACGIAMEKIPIQEEPTTPTTPFSTATTPQEAAPRFSFFSNFRIPFQLRALGLASTNNNNNHHNNNSPKIDENCPPVASPPTKAVLHCKKHRFRCHACGTEFCARCKTIPYHTNRTCKQFVRWKKERHCRFCGNEVPERNSKPTPNPKTLSPRAVNDKGKEKLFPLSLNSDPDPDLELDPDPDPDSDSSPFSSSFHSSLSCSPDTGIPDNPFQEKKPKKKKRFGLELENLDLPPKSQNEHENEKDAEEKEKEKEKEKAEAVEKDNKEEAAAMMNGSQQKEKDSNENEMMRCNNKNSKKKILIIENVESEKEEKEEEEKKVEEDEAEDTACCGAAECVVKKKAACLLPLPCGHHCYGIRGESACIPCLHPDCARSLPQVASDFCSICYVEELGAAPCIQLTCTHIFHLECVKKKIMNGWSGSRITFGYLDCPLCKEQITHPELDPLLAPALLLYHQVREKALQRLQMMSLTACPAITSPDSPFYQQPAKYAMHRFSYYLCFKCKKPYFGGDKACEAEERLREFKADELVCGGCCDLGGQSSCPEHGTEYIEYKCRYCCNIAVWFCWGTTHFCDECHKNAADLITASKKHFPKCTCGIDHPPNGEEFSLGCSLCRA